MMIRAAKRAQKACLRIKKKEMKEKAARIAQEMSVCWEQKKFSHIWRLVCLSSKTNVGPKKRWRNTAPASRPTLKEWETHHALQPKEGGMGAHSPEETQPPITEFARIPRKVKGGRSL